jgi:hypothetical protein
VATGSADTSIKLFEVCQQLLKSLTHLHLCSCLPCMPIILWHYITSFSLQFESCPTVFSFNIFCLSAWSLITLQFPVLHRWRRSGRWWCQMALFMILPFAQWFVHSMTICRLFLVTLTNLTSLFWHFFCGVCELLNQLKKENLGWCSQ